MRFVSSATQPVRHVSLGEGRSYGAKEWLEALSIGACDEEAFFAGVGMLLQRTADAGWDLLALLDQYYRRGKFSLERFTTLNTRLRGVVMGKRQTGPSSMPLPLVRDEPPALPSSSPSAGSPKRTIAPGDVLRDRYRVQGVLGQGGMGTVFSAIDQYRLDDPNGDPVVAIKVLHTEVIKRPRLFAELRREFQHLQRLSHPNIVRVHEFDREGDLAFFTMEQLSGALLSRVLSTQGSSAMHRPYALAIMRDVGAAVTYAHARGVVHGDLYPGNIFITDTGEIRVLDFGASHQLHRAPWISEFEGAGRIAVATPMYASCQLLEGETADARDDVYALACIAYVLLSGRHPFGDNTALQARTLELVPHRPPRLHKHQWNALRAGLCFDREKRPSDVRSWLAKLDLRSDDPLPALTLLDPPPLPRGNGLKWAALVGLGVLVVGTGWWATANVNFRDGTSRAMDAVQRAFTSSGSRLGTDSLSPDRDVSSSPAITEAPPVDTAADAVSATPAADVAAPASPPRVSPSEGTPAAVPPAVRPGLASAAPASVRPAPPSATPAAARPPLANDDPFGDVPSQKHTELAASLRARIELAAGSLDVPPGEPVAYVTVRRSRLLRGDASFTWWTESGTAKPGQDFVPVKSRVEHIEPGKTTATLAVSLVADPARRQSRSFYVVIDEAGEDAAVGPRTVTMVTLAAPD